MNTRTAAARIFLSYRRDDVPDAVLLIAEKLRARFGPASVFMDTASTKPGESWRDVLARSLAKCEALLIVMGTRWLREGDEGERKAIDDPEDVVRQEIAAALERDISVVPVLWEDAELPAPEALPLDVRDLTHYQAYRMRRDRFDTDVRFLLERVQTQIGCFATLGRRLVAFLIDMLPALVLAAALAPSSPGATFWTFWVLWVAYHGVLLGTSGRTLGKLVMGTKIESPRTSRSRWLFSFLRPIVGYPIILLSVGVGAIQLILHPQHIGLHDRVFGTRVIQTRRRPGRADLRRIDAASYSFDAWLLRVVTIAGLGFTIALAQAYLGFDRIVEWLGTWFERLRQALRGLRERARRSDAREAVRAAENLQSIAAAPVGSAGGAIATAAAPKIVVGLGMATASVGLHQTVAPSGLQFPDPVRAVRHLNVLDLSGRWEFTNVQTINEGVYQPLDLRGTAIAFEPVRAGFVVSEGPSFLLRTVLRPRLSRNDSILASDSTVGRASCVNRNDGSLVAADVYASVTTWTFTEIPDSRDEGTASDPLAEKGSRAIRFHYVLDNTKDSEDPSAATCPDEGSVRVLAELRRIPDG